MKAIRKNDVVKKTADHLKLNIPETYINRSAIYEWKSPNNTQDSPYAVVSTSPTHSQPVVESQQTQQRNVGITVVIFFPLKSTDVTMRTENDQNQIVDVNTGAYSLGLQNLNDVSDDIINTLSSKTYISSIDMQGIALVDEGEVGIELDAGGNPVILYTVDISTHSLLTIST